MQSAALATVLAFLFAWPSSISASSHNARVTAGVDRRDGSSELFNFHALSHGFGLKDGIGGGGGGAEEHVHYHEPSAPRGLTSDGHDSTHQLIGQSSDTSFGSGVVKFPGDAGPYAAPVPSPPPSYFRRPRRPPFVYPQLGASEDLGKNRPQSTSGFVSSDQHPFFNVNSATPTPEQVFPELFGTPSSISNSGEFRVRPSSAVRKNRNKPNGRRPGRRPPPPPEYLAVSLFPSTRFVS
jgi:hypothetical protein